MKAKKKLIVPAIAAIMVILGTVIAFFPVINVNVIFDRCVNANELATVFKDTSFKSYEYYQVFEGSAGGGMTSNSQLFGTSLEGNALKSALDAEPQNTGIAVLDGRVSLIDIFRIKKNPFVEDVVVYFIILYRGDREILAESSTRFFDNNPEARYWE